MQVVLLASGGWATVQEVLVSELRFTWCGQN